MDSTAAFPLVEGLIDSWCERRALCPLRIILQAYPLVGFLSEDWFRLRDSLRFVRAECRDDLLDDEANQLERALALVDNAVVRYEA